MTDVASQVGPKFDVVINGRGYMFDKTQPTRAVFGYTPTFLERQNVSGRFGDNEQDFYLTVSQNDWSGGEGQRFLRVNDQKSASRYWQGDAVNINVPGQVTAQTRFDTTISLASGVTSCVGCGVFLDGKLAWVDAAAHLWTTTSGGSATDNGAHGAGTGNRWGLAVDPNHVYISGSTSIRSWNASAFSTFASVSNAGSLSFLNNVLYSCDGATLRSYDSAGAATTEYIWRDAVGTIVTPSATGIRCKIIPYGGKLLIFRNRGQYGRPELWIFDGIETSQVGDFPDSSIGYDIVDINGVVYMSGSILQMNATATVTSQPVIWYYLNGTLDELWRSVVATASSSIGDGAVWPALGSYEGRMVFTDNSRGEVMQYDPPSGAFSSLGSYSFSGSSQANDSTFIASDRAYTGLFNTHASPIILFPSSAANIATSAYIRTSLIDFDNSLTKLFRGVKAEFTGNGTVDIAYQLNTLASSYTTLATSVTSGTEVSFATSTAGISVSLQFTLNPSGGSPVFKRYYLRGAPELQQFRNVTYLLDLSGRTDAGELSNPVRFADGSFSTLTGAQMLANLAALSNTAFSVTDEVGTFNAVVEWGSVEFREVRPKEYVARVTLREV